ncbi:MAG: dTMP kinase [Eubacteriales Family XIII. Incertae Sedis bacterium]|nr:MAG: dTMP kinase [Clostridiales Family XIII bacterium]
MKNGLFISIEGPDGSGKSTQIEVLRKYFEKQGIDVLLTREPGGTPISEKIREIILDKNNMEMDDMTEALLYAASRAQHVAEVIKPALAAGKIVICDRFIDSSIAYQGYGRELGDCVRVINEYAVRGCIPDMTFLMKMDPKVGKERISESEQDRLEQEKLDFHRRVFDGYIEMEERFDRIIGIDAERSIDEISADIISHIERIIGENGRI